MRTISSSFTFFYKYIFTGLWIGMFGFGTLTMIRSPEIDNSVSYKFLFAWILGTTLICLICGSVKKVQIDGKKVIISNYISSEKIDPSQITHVSGSLLLSPELVWFKVRGGTRFGDTIVFMPQFRFFSGFSKHPVVYELRRLCQLER